jgi:hypothetical protein
MHGACGTLLVLAATLAVSRARADDPPSSSVAFRTSLVWIYGDDDVLHAAGDSVPPSPASGFGDRPGYAALFEGYASRYTGRENRSEIDLDASAPGFSPAWVTRARLAVALDASSLGVRSAPIALEDVGSFVEVEWRFGARRTLRPNALALRVFPLNADRERVGELEALGWGGAVGPAWESPYAAADGPVRAGRLELTAGFVRLHAALKTATFLEPAQAGPALAETSYGAFGGASSRWSAPIGVTFDVGHFEHGRLPGGPSAPRATTTGASLRVRAGAGFVEPAPPLGFGLERSPFDASAAVTTEAPAEPDAAGRALEPASNVRGFALAVEAAHLVQRLWDFDHPGVTALAGCRALAVVGEARSAGLDVRALVSLRNPEFVLRNGPGAFPGQTLPRDAERGDEIGAALGISFALGRVVRPSLAAGVLRPAFVAVHATDASGQASGATLVLRGPSDVEALPAGAGPVPVFELRPGLGLRLSRLLEAMLWAQYQNDGNRTRLVPADGGALARGFRAPGRLGYGIAARAVW